MTMTDPIADMLTRLRNANAAHLDTVSMPSSKMKAGIAKILENEGYIAKSEVTDARVGKTLTLTLKYGSKRERAITGCKRVSKPGLRKYDKIHSVAEGHGRPWGGNFVHLLWPYD